MGRIPSGLATSAARGSAIRVHVTPFNLGHAVRKVSGVIILVRPREGGTCRIHGAIRLLDNLTVANSGVATSEVPATAAIGAVGEAPAIFDEFLGNEFERRKAVFGYNGEKIGSLFDDTCGAGILVLEGSPRLVDHRGGEAGAVGAGGIEELEVAPVVGAAARLGPLAGAVGEGKSGLVQLADVDVAAVVLRSFFYECSS